nr:hypothetical protein [Tanacetum cinerariifolium]
MVVIDDHDMIDTGEGSIPRDVIETGEGSIPTDVFDLDLLEDEKPKLGDIFNTFDDGYNMYKVYSEKGRFNICKSSIKQYKGKVTHRVTNCPTKIGLKVIHGTDCYKLFDFVENHSHPLMNENNMDLSRPRHQMHFNDYMYIHRALLSNIGPTLAHRLKVALMGGYDKVCGTPGDYRNFKRAVNQFIGDRDAVKPT